MGVEVDWSKAPEGATHWSFGHAYPWMKESDGVVFRYVLDGWMAVHPQELAKQIIRKATPRPAESAPVWAGEGLPPVGTVCEVLNNTLDRPEWERCTILFMGKFKAVYESDSCHERVADVSEDWMISFRPLRTPEQIAAEERLHSVRNACSAIAETLDALRGKTKLERAALRVVEAMIDAGYAR